VHHNDIGRALSFARPLCAALSLVTFAACTGIGEGSPSGNQTGTNSPAGGLGPGLGVGGAGSAGAVANIFGGNLTTFGLGAGQTNKELSGLRIG